MAAKAPPDGDHRSFLLQAARTALDAAGVLAAQKHVRMTSLDAADALSAMPDDFDPDLASKWVQIMHCSDGMAIGIGLIAGYLGETSLLRLRSISRKNAVGTHETLAIALDAVQEFGKSGELTALREHAELLKTCDHNFFRDESHYQFECSICGIRIADRKLYDMFGHLQHRRENRHG